MAIGLIRAFINGSLEVFFLILILVFFLVRMTFKASSKSDWDSFWCRVRYEMTSCASCKDLNLVGFDMSWLNCVSSLCCVVRNFVNCHVICEVCDCVPIAEVILVITDSFTDLQTYCAAYAACCER